jgi:hypothetical protein
MDKEIVLLQALHPHQQLMYVQLDMSVTDLEIVFLQFIQLSVLLDIP